MRHPKIAPQSNPTAGTVIYKPCAKACGKCADCKSFAAIVREIDLTKTSPSDRQRRNIIRSE
jgi:hypothetical protein